MKSYQVIYAALLCSSVLSQCESAELSNSKLQAKPIQDLSDVGEKNSGSVQSQFDYTSGPVHLNGIIAQADQWEGKYIKRYETEGRDFFLLDSARIAGGKFIFDLKDVVPGIYKIGTASDPSKLAELILSPAEPEIDIVFNSPHVKTGIAQTNSRENEGFKSYKALENKHLSDLQRIRSGSSPNKRQEVYDEQAAFKLQQERLAASNEGTYLANMLRHLQSPNRFSKQQYWSDIDFKDASLIRSPVFPDRIEDYMRIHASSEKSQDQPLIGFYNAVDQIAGQIKEKGSDEVLEYALYTMSEGFYSSGMEELSLYVVDNYFYGDACGDANISELFKMKAAGIRNLQVGNTPPDFALSSAEKRKIEFGKIAAQNEYTLLVFWASFCHKCEREIPEIKQVYSQYRQKGFDVVAVSLDTDRKSWTEGMESNQTPWKNVSDLKGWRSEVARDFRVTSTPVLFVVDRDRKLVAKPKSAGELQAFLKSNL